MTEEQEVLEFQAIIERLEEIHAKRQNATTFDEATHIDKQADAEFSKYHRIMDKSI